MANALYNTFKQALLNGEINLATDTIVAYAIDTADYTFSAAHETLSQLTSAGRVAGPITLTSKTITNGVFDAADIVFPSVTGDSIEAVVLLDSTSDNLICYLDGLSLTPTGNNVNCAWSASGIFAL